MPISDDEAARLAGHILSASDDRRLIAPLTDDSPQLQLADAYLVAAEIIRRRLRRGERPVGWKIGFTNRTIWDEYAVHAPIWGPIYDSTLASVETPAETASCGLGGLLQPRIEPEIAFRIASVPHPEMEERELLACIDAVGHGYEIVQSLFPDWRFRAADTVAAFALHGRYLCGPLYPLNPAGAGDWTRDLSRFEIALSCDGRLVDRGRAENVLGGPLSALRHFVRGLAELSFPRRIEAGDLVTTGTVTRAFPVAPGERWTSEVIGLPLPGLSVRFA